jgi:uncharacterized protein (DUF1697 family)
MVVLQHVALLRGINVGGKNLLPMKALAEIFAGLGCSDVRTYIQSGNVIFRAPARVLKTLPARVSGKIAEQFSHRVPVIVRSSAELGAVVQATPFEPGKALHVLFLADRPDDVAAGKLDAARSPGDLFHLSGREVYLYLTNGAGNTKLTNAYFDAKLSTVSTGRNWATVLKLLELSSTT